MRNRHISYSTLDRNPAWNPAWMKNGRGFDLTDRVFWRASLQLLVSEARKRRWEEIQEQAKAVPPPPSPPPKPKPSNKAPSSPHRRSEPYTRHNLSNGGEDDDDAAL